MNERSVIQAQNKLSIYAINLTNKAYMFDYVLEYRYTIMGTKDKWNMGCYTKNYYESYNIAYQYTYSNLTVGKILGEHIEINLGGKFSQDGFIDGVFSKAFRYKWEKEYKHYRRAQNNNISARGSK